MMGSTLGTGSRGIGSRRVDMVPNVKLEVVVSDDDNEEG